MKAVFLVLLCVAQCAAWELSSTVKNFEQETNKQLQAEDQKSKEAERRMMDTEKKVQDMEGKLQMAEKKLADTEQRLAAADAKVKETEQKVLAFIDAMNPSTLSMQP